MNYETSLDADHDAATMHETDTAIEREDRGLLRRPRLWWIIAGLLLAALIVWAVIAAFAADDVVEETDQAPAITFITPGRGTVEGRIEATGTLAARRTVPIGVVGEGGRVVSVNVDAGDWVNQGQVLVTVDRGVQNQQASAQSAQIQVAQADADLAQANLDRALQLVERGFISKAEIDRLTATRDAAVARVRVAQAQLRELRERTNRLNIVAPASGLVLERNVEPGQTISAGSPPVFVLARGGEMELMARLSETDLAGIAVGTQAQVTPAGTEKSFTGQVWQVAPVIDETSRQGTARIALPYARELRPGGFATAVISSGTVVAPLIPESALLSDDEGNFVYIIDGENKIRRRAIRTGIVTPDGTTVIEGLNGTERIVLRAGGFVNEGETVDPRAAAASGE
jgi:RND family efflux transporter MFP subunit